MNGQSGSHDCCPKYNSTTVMTSPLWVTLPRLCDLRRPRGARENVFTDTFIFFAAPELFSHVAAAVPTVRSDQAAGSSHAVFVSRSEITSSGGFQYPACRMGDGKVIDALLMSAGGNPSIMEETARLGFSQMQLPYLTFVSNQKSCVFLNILRLDVGS